MEKNTQKTGMKVMTKEEHKKCHEPTDEVYAARMKNIIIEKDQLNRIYQETIDLWGREANINQMFQEMAELQVELTNILRKRTSRNKIALEIADVEIMLELLKVMFDNEGKVEEIKKKQIKKLERQMQHEIRR